MASELVSTADLGWMRTTQGKALPGTAVVERYTTLADGMGGFSETWATVGTVDCRLMQQPLQSAEDVAGGQVLSTTRWWATMPHDTDVLALDRLLVADRHFEVSAVNNDKDYFTAVRAECVALNEETRI